MSLGWDDEAPTGFQDADLELAEFEAEADREAYEADLSPEERNELHRFDEVEEREPYMTAAELRFEAALDEQSSYEDYLGLNDY
jgi:transcription initiation factor TFIIIB Brf1 subunit/transcription initiation factor TFIIB